MLSREHLSKYCRLLFAIAVAYVATGYVGLQMHSLKYAFPNGRPGQVVVELQSAPSGFYTFRVSDDGIGLPEALDLKELKSLGLQLVQDLIQQLSGTLKITYGQGTEFCITFPLRYTHQEYEP